MPHYGLHKFVPFFGFCQHYSLEEVEIQQSGKEQPLLNTQADSVMWLENEIKYAQYVMTMLDLWCKSQMRVELLPFSLLLANCTYLTSHWVIHKLLLANLYNHVMVKILICQTVLKLPKLRIETVVSKISILRDQTPDDASSHIRLPFCLCNYSTVSTGKSMLMDLSVIFCLLD